MNFVEQNGIAVAIIVLKAYTYVGITDESAFYNNYFCGTLYWNWLRLIRKINIALVEMKYRVGEHL